MKSSLDAVKTFLIAQVLEKKGEKDTEDNNHHSYLKNSLVELLTPDSMRLCSTTNKSSKNSTFIR